MTKTNQLAQFLLKLNKKLYNYWFHIPVFLVWFSLLCYNASYVAKWFWIGLVVYVIMMTYMLLYKKKRYNSDFLGYLIGLNLFVVFGPLVFALLYILKDYKPNKDKR